MAELFLARITGEAGFEKTCVVKRVLPHLAASSEFVEMFLDEARTAARLDHPGIVQIFDLGREGDDYFIAMEYLAGEDLFAVFNRAAELGEPVPVEIALRLIASAAEALHSAHTHRRDDGTELGIVHRDISLSNLMLTYRGAVKVLDFGIARAADRVQRTSPGRVRGKVGYMSPEQTLGQSLDRRTDVWALGVCLYELLTSERLFPGRAFEEVAARIRTVDVPPPSLRRRDVPAAVDTAVLRALARDPEARFSTAQQLAEELERQVAGTTPTAHLGRYLRHLFGDERAERQLRLSSAAEPSHRPPTLDLAAEGATETVSQTAPQLEAAHPEAPRARAPRRWWPGAAAALLLAAALAGAWVGRDRLAAVKPEAVAPLPEVAQQGAPPVEPTQTALAPAPAAPQEQVERPPAAPAPVARAVRPRPPRPAAAREPRAVELGSLTLVTAPFAVASVAGRELGTTPLFRSPLPAGTWTLELKESAGTVHRLPVTIRAGDDTALRLNLRALTPQAPPAP
ncbi:MAG: serine/threonine protein kinase [Archangiaceae bacterium]|nr:serine/threonine protein kinase [Archangiaceae bacterium]